MWTFGWLLACATGGTSPEPAPETPKREAVTLTAFAAASLTDVLPQVAETWHTETGHTVTFSFGGSSKLAKQLESGQPADLFFSADTAWMDTLSAAGRVGPAVPLLGNTLVVVVRADGGFAPQDPAALSGPGLVHLAMAGENVPAGRYGQDALTSLGAWPAVEGRVVRGDDVRAALGWVATGEAEAGVVYATDARAEPRVKVAFPFPADSHAPIVYPAAVTTRSAHPDEARAFLEFCRSERARALFAAAGFTTP